MVEKLIGTWKRWVQSPKARQTSAQLNFISFVISNCGRNHAEHHDNNQSLYNIYIINHCGTIFISSPTSPDRRHPGQNLIMLCNTRAINTTQLVPKPTSASSTKAAVWAAPSNPSQPTSDNPDIYLLSNFNQQGMGSEISEISNSMLHISNPEVKLSLCMFCDSPSMVDQHRPSSTEVPNHQCEHILIMAGEQRRQG